MRIIDWNKESPLAALSLPALSSNPCCDPLDMAFCNIRVVCLLDVFMLCTAIGVCLPWSIIGEMYVCLVPICSVSFLFVTQVAMFVCFIAFSGMISFSLVGWFLTKLLSLCVSIFPFVMFTVVNIFPLICPCYWYS